VLLQEFAGAPLAITLAPARRAVLETLGLAGPADRWVALEQHARAVIATDVVGLEHDLPLGAGELPAAPPSLLGTGAQVVAGRADSTFREISRARRRCEEIRVETAAANAAAAAERGSASAQPSTPDAPGRR
jgi:hypothetical protein